MFLRSMFAARGIPIVVGAEHHASLLGALGSSFLSLDIWVDDEESEEATALLRDLRDRGPDSRGAGAESHPLEGEEDDDDDDDQPGESVQAQLERRRRTGVVLLLGVFITFGTAHMFTRAWVRGLALAAVQIAGIFQITHGHPAGAVAVAAAVVTDFVGALWRIRSTRVPELPVARTRRAS